MCDCIALHKFLKILMKSYVMLCNEKDNELTTIVTRCEQVRCN
jgi:hypothetical protein